MGALSLAAVGAAAGTLIGRTFAGAGRAMPAERQVEGFAILGTVPTALYELAGPFLALLPIRWVVLSGTAVAVATMALVPGWERIMDKPAS